MQVNGYWHSNTIQNLTLAHRWFPLIEKKLKENGVPDDFKYIALAESGLRNVTSPSNAEGCAIPAGHQQKHITWS